MAATAGRLPATCQPTPFRPPTPLDAPVTEVWRGSTRRQAGIRLGLLGGVVAALAVVGVGGDVDAVRGWTAGGGWLAAVVSSCCTPA